MAEPIAEYGNLSGVCGHDGTDWIKLQVDADGKLQITVDTSALPSGAATAANQATMIAALQLISDLRNALHTVAADELDVVVTESVLPSDAATETTLNLIRVGQGGLLEADDLNLDASGSAGVNQHQYDGSAWRKSNMLFGYNDRYAERVYEPNLAAGANTVYGTTVPDGEVWIVTTFIGQCVGATITILVFGSNNDVYPIPVVVQQPPVTGQWYVWTGTLVLKAGDRIYGYVAGATLGNDLDIRALGYKMNIAM
jgi:hypothetical protein